MKELLGIKIIVSPDIPKIQLSDGADLAAGDYVTPQCRAETNAWVLGFFGTTNMLNDGETICSCIGPTSWMNSRTFEQFKKATK